MSTPSSTEKSERTGKRRKTMWDADSTGEPATAAVTSPTPQAASTADAAAATDAAAHAIAQAQLQQMMQQQQLLQQVRTLAQQRVTEVAAQQTTAPVAHSVANRIYVGNLFYELTETELLLTFSVFGPIIKIDMPKDPSTGRHKGFCFIEFASPDSAATAVATMQEFVLGGRPIKVGRPNNFAATMAASTPTVFPNLLQQAQILQATGVASPSGANMLQAKLQAQAVAAAISQQKLVSPLPDVITPVVVAPVQTKIYVGSIFYEIKEEDIKAIFSAFGAIKNCQLLPNPETGKHKGYGFVDYENEASAKAAIASMNGFELAGRQLKVGWASASTGVPSQVLPLGTIPLAAMTGGVAIAPSDATAAKVEKVTGAADSAAPAVKPTRCIVLLNMVGPDEVDEDLNAEVTEECSKYGEVEKVVVHQEDESKQHVDAPVRIFVLFTKSSEAESAHKALHGRWFGGRQVLARFFEEEKLENEDFSL